MAANTYEVDEQAVAALGVTLSSGRAFEPNEILPPIDTFDSAPQAIVTKAFASSMFPDDPNPVGKTFYDGLSKPTTIVGIIEHMHGAWVGWDKLDHVVLFPRIKNGPVDRLPGAHRAGPPRRGDARDRGEARRLEPRPPAALGPAVRLLHRPVLPGRPQHGDLPGERHERAARDHRARHLRPRDLQRLDAHPPDRHAPRGRRARAGHRAALPGRELDGHDRGRRRRLRRRARHRLLDLGQVRTAAARPLLPGRRRARDLADRPRRGPAAGAPRLGASPPRSRAGRSSPALWEALQRLPDTAHPSP